MRFLLKLTAFLGMLWLTGCAYLSSGAAQNVLITPKESDDSVFVNRHYLGQGPTSVMLLKKNDYVINIKTDSNRVVSEKIRSRRDVGSLFLDYPIFYYGYPVDLSTGSYRNMKDGENYKVLASAKRNVELDALNARELEERGAFKSSLWGTALALELFGAVAVSGEAASLTSHNSPTVERVVGVLAAACAGGIVYEISKTVKAVKAINRINRDKEYK